MSKRKYLRSRAGMNLALAMMLAVSLATSRAADGPPAPAPEVNEVLNALLAAVEAPKSIEFESRTEIQDTEIFRELARLPPKADSGRVVDVHLWSNGAKYLYSKAIQEFGEGASRVAEYAYDGKSFQVFSPRTGLLMVSAADSLGRHFRLGFSSPLNQFGFLSGEMKGVEPSIPWSLIKDAAAWKAAFARARLVKVETMGEERRVVLEFAGGQHRVFQIPCWYVVTFSSGKGFFPVEWKAVDNKGRRLEDFSIDEFELMPAGGRTWYPARKSTMHWYTEEGKYPEGAPQGIFVTKVLNIAFDTATEDEKYTIDRARAQTIYDEDLKTVVPGPK